MSKIIATSLISILAIASIQACAQLTLEPSLSLDSIQGAWWSDCPAPAAEFVIEGEEYFGDFSGRHNLELAGDVLVFRDGLIDGHSVNVTHEALLFHVITAAAGQLVLRGMPGQSFTGDWHLYSCSGSSIMTHIEEAGISP